MSYWYVCIRSIRLDVEGGVEVDPEVSYLVFLLMGPFWFTSVGTFSRDILFCFSMYVYTLEVGSVLVAITKLFKIVVLGL